MFDSIYAFKCNLNVLLECIESFNTVQCILYVPITLLDSINLILAYYAFNYADLFDSRGLLTYMMKS